MHRRALALHADLGAASALSLAVVEQLSTGGSVLLETPQRISHAGGRWRCVQYWVRRARLSLAMMEQLDMTGRTGELARAFGIDFFSVLTRGSQYRVEAMMVRLAHTQKYLLPAPSKPQVGSGESELLNSALSCRVGSSEAVNTAWVPSPL